MSSVISPYYQISGVPPIKLKTRARGLQIEAAPADTSEGQCSHRDHLFVTSDFALPWGTVYVGTMMKARLEMLKAVQQLARGVPPSKRHQIRHNVS